MSDVLSAYPWIAEKFAALRNEPDGRVTAQCPLRCHRTGRVQFTLGGKGNLLVKCWAGCNVLEMLRVVGCAGWGPCFKEGTVPEWVKQEIVARYPYHDADGKLLYQTIRLEPGTRGRDKDFRQRRPKEGGGGGWHWDLTGVSRVLYRLPELLAAAPTETIFCVGGEKDVENLRRIGLVATTNVCGERAEWLDNYSLTLQGHPVVVIEDRDSAGARHTAEVCGSLMAWGATSVQRAKLPAKDATAFLNALRANDVTARADLRDFLFGELEKFPVWEPKAPTSAESK